MMFNFFSSDVELQSPPQKEELGDTPTTLRDSQEIHVQQRHYDIATKVNSEPLEKYAMKYIRTGDLITSNFIQDHPQVKNILNSTSDLLSGTYEGGFKLWECSFDLLAYLEERSNDDNGTGLNLGATNVLDLGCGHGLLGAYCLAKGASVVFQDYNEEVLNFLTIPNTILNFGDEGLLRSRYYDGSWSSFLEFVKKTRETNSHAFQYDVILSSETIYNLEYLPDLIELIRICLKPSGTLFLAAKTCYFGVGGGIQAFIKLIDSETSTLSVKTVKVIKDGIQRQILEVKHKNATSD